LRKIYRDKAEFTSFSGVEKEGDYRGLEFNEFLRVSYFSSDNAD